MTKINKHPTKFPVQRRTRIKARKQWVYFLLMLPGLIFLLFPAALGQLGAKPWKTLLISSGFCTLGCLTLSLLLTPLVRIFPSVSFFKWLNRYRRAIGESAFLYALLHILFYFIGYFLKKRAIPLSLLLKPVIFTGSSAFLILCMLALTSNDGSIRRLTYQKWKRVHRTVYFAEAFIFLHLIYQSSPYAYYIFVPLVTLQGIRILKSY